MKNEVGMEDFGRYMAGGKALIGDSLKTKRRFVAALESRGRDFAARLEAMTEAQLAEHVAFPAPIQPPSRHASRCCSRSRSTRCTIAGS